MKRQWEVEWISSMPIDQFGDADIDRAKYTVQRFPTEALARAFAKEAAGKSYWGCAQLGVVEPTTREAILADEDGTLEYWIEKGQPMMYVGEREEIEA